jgi:hypothetical protein
MMLPSFSSLLQANKSIAFDATQLAYSSQTRDQELLMLTSSKQSSPNRRSKQPSPDKRSIAIDANQLPSPNRRSKAIDASQLGQPSPNKQIKSY